MTEADTLAKALADVRQRRADLQADYERISAELTKLRMAEKSLAAIVEGVALQPADGAESEAGAGESAPRSARATGRGSRGPRANSAKGRLRALLEGAGPQGLSQAEIVARLPDVAPNTLGTYLSVMTAGGEAVRRGDFYTAHALRPEPAADEGAEEDAEADGDA